MIGSFIDQEIAELRGDAFTTEIRPLCAYYRGEGICSFGCREEPVCLTDEPEGGWHWSAYKRWIDVAETLRAIVREGRDDLTHADVTHLRGMARETHRRAVINLRLAGEAAR